MKKYFGILFVVYVSFVLSCNIPISIDKQIPEPLPVLCAKDSSLIKSDNTFGFKLFKKILEKDKSSNIFISPLSVSMALGMTYNGSRGETKEQMKSCLELSDLSDQEINDSYKRLLDFYNRVDTKIKLSIANSIWYRLDFNVEQDFINLNKQYFNAEVKALDFTKAISVSTINNWVSNATNSKISNIIQSINPLDVMFLINAIYFKGIWTYQFDSKNTTDADFSCENGNVVKCKMMHRSGRCNIMINQLFKAAELDYGNHSYSMVVILPHSFVSIDSVIFILSSTNWNNLTDSLLPDSGDIYIPKFKLEYELSLISTLQALGMVNAFSPQLADFTGISSSSEIYISEVKHKTFVEVNEEGTEASAVTSVTISLTSLPEPLIRADRPFIFAIREKKSGGILFIGKIGEPKI
jgi:serpin B